MLSGNLTQNLPTDKLLTTATLEQTIFLLLWSLEKRLLLSYRFSKLGPLCLPHYVFKLSVFFFSLISIINLVKTFHNILTSCSKVYVFSNQINFFFVKSNVSGFCTLFFLVNKFS